MVIKLPVWSYHGWSGCQSLDYVLVRKLVGLKEEGYSVASVNSNPTIMTDKEIAARVWH